MSNNAIMLLDPSIGSDNLGDYIISEYVDNELSSIIPDTFTYKLPTHLPTFHSYAVWRNSLAVQNYSSCRYKFVGGSNLLVKNMLTHYPQWNVNIFNYKPLQGCILVGVGAGAGEQTNLYTTTLYKKMLSNEYYHSVRDERTKIYVESLGLKAINTGCVTMWGLTPDFCKEIPYKKSDNVVFTLTGRSNSLPVNPNDQDLIDILVRNYKKVYYWIQGGHDAEYIRRFNNTDRIEFIPPSKQAYHSLLLQPNLDYVGTRLHGGIYAMRHKKRAIIIAIDERAREINKANNLNCIEQRWIPTKLETMIHSEFTTDIKMPFDDIMRWKKQFR